MTVFKVAGLRRQTNAIGIFEPFLVEVNADDHEAASAAVVSDPEFEVQVRAVVPVTDVKKRTETLANMYWKFRWEPGGTITDDNDRIVDTSTDAKRAWEEMGKVTANASRRNEATLIRCSVPEKIAKVTASPDDLTLEAECLRWTGHSPVDGYHLDRFLSPPLRYIEEWSHSFRTVWTDDDRLIVTYCEGDLSGQLFFTPEAYAAAIAKATEFYKEH